MAEGWVKLHRGIRKHWIWEDSQKLQWWLDIILQANHQDKKILLGNELMVVERGSFHTSVVKLSVRWKVDRKTVKRFLELLENDQMIAIIMSPKGTTIKVSNYEDFQGISSEEVDNKRDNKVPAHGTTQGTAKSHQSPSERDTNKNDKECNKNEEELKNNKECPQTHSLDRESIQICKYYESLTTRTISHFTAEINALIDMYTYEWVREAVSKAVSQGKGKIHPKQFLSYIGAILKNWASEGKEAALGGSTNQNNGAGKSEGYDFTEIGG